MMKDMSKNSVSQISAQIGIIVILITAAVLTFGLSVANRVVQENKIVVDRSDSIRTFNTAETGVDDALNKIYLYETEGEALPTGDFSTNPLNKLSISSNQTFEGYLNQGESLRIDLNPIAGNIVLNWSKTRCASNYKVGLLLTLLHLDGSEYQNHYYLIGDNDDDCLNNPIQQNFIDAELLATNTYKYRYTLAVPSLTNATLYIQTVGAGTDLEVSSGSINNAQYRIESLAKSENEVSYKTIEVDKSLPSAPGFMTFALFSGGTITK